MVLKVKMANHVKDLMVELQDAFEYLREAVIAIPNSTTKEQLIFYIDKIVDLYNRRNLKSLEDILAIITDIAKQESVAQEVKDIVAHIQGTFVELFGCFGKAPKHNLDFDREDI